jgi:hypothetical protein
MGYLFDFIMLCCGLVHTLRRKDTLKSRMGVPVVLILLSVVSGLVWLSGCIALTLGTLCWAL